MIIVEFSYLLDCVYSYTYLYNHSFIHSFNKYFILGMGWAMRQDDEQIMLTSFLCRSQSLLVRTQ